MWPISKLFPFMPALPSTANGSNHSVKLLWHIHGELPAVDPIWQHFEENLGWESFVPYHLEKMVMM